jgi:hypothetical protein
LAGAGKALTRYQPPDLWSIQVNMYNICLFNFLFCVEFMPESAYHADRSLMEQSA